MTLSLTALLVMARETLRTPRDGARAILRMDLPPSAGWIALAFTAVASSLLTHLALAMVPVAERPPFPSPVAMAILQAGLMVATAFAILLIGRWRGGTGRWPDAILLMAWLQFILLCLQVVQLAVLMVLPMVSDLIGLLAIAVFFWLLTAFVAEIHGFRSLGSVFAAILGSVFVLAILLSVLLSPFLQLPA